MYVQCTLYIVHFTMYQNKDYSDPNIKTNLCLILKL